MDVSLAIAQVLGVFFLFAGVSMLLNSKATAAALQATADNRGILWIWGMIALLIGAVIVVLNNTWTSGLPLFITILGWLALLKGAYIFLFPTSAAALYKSVSKGGFLIAAGLVSTVLGILLFAWYH